MTLPATSPAAAPAPIPPLAATLATWIGRVCAGAGPEAPGPAGAPDRAGWLGAALPFAFVYGGRPSADLLPSWERRASLPAPPEGAGAGAPATGSVSLRDPQTGLVVTWEATLYPDTPAVTWLLTFRNEGPRDTPILERVRALHLRAATDPYDLVRLLRHRGARHPGRLRPPGALPAQRAPRPLPPRLRRGAQQQRRLALLRRRDQRRRRRRPRRRRRLERAVGGPDRAGALRPAPGRRARPARPERSGVRLPQPRPPAPRSGDGGGAPHAAPGGADPHAPASCSSPGRATAGAGRTPCAASCTTTSPPERWSPGRGRGRGGSARPCRRCGAAWASPTPPGRPWAPASPTRGSPPLGAQLPRVDYVLLDAGSVPGPRLVPRASATTPCAGTSSLTG